jgi:PAS domain S-box-containing protein
MQQPTIPKNEEKRISELDSYKIIGELESEDYDFLTQMAAQICDTKISLISLVTNEKQWFLSHHGLKERETPKELAFCAHAINTPEDIFVIEDATQDDRFHDNPLVTGYPKVIFYAGMPLITENGYPLGTICVIDDHPKKLSKKQIDSLKLLSKQVIKLLQLRRKTFELEAQNKELEKTSLLFNESQRINKIGAWEFNITTGSVFWTDEVYQIHEVANDLVFDKSKAIDFYHPDDRHIITNAIENAISKGEAFDVQCRFITAKNNFKWVRSSGKVWKENGKITKLFGTFQDITKLKDSEQKFQGIFNSTFSFIGLLDTKGVLTEANETSIKTAGIKQEDVIGKPFWDCYWWQISKQTQKELKENFNKVLKGEEITYEVVIWVANQNPVTILFSMRPVFDQDNNVVYVVPEGRPIQEMVDDKFRYKAVLEGTNVGTWEWNIQTGKTIYNERWAEIIGYTLNELGPLNNMIWRKNVHSDDLKETDKRLKDCFERKTEYYENEVRIKHKNGSWIWVLDKGKVFSWTEDGKPLMMYGTHLDITERKNTEEQLRINEEAFRANFEQAAIGMALLNDKGKWLKVNKKLCKILGYTEKELLKLTFQDITYPTDLEADLKLLEELIKGKRDSYTMEKRYFHKNGEIVYVILGVSMVRDENGKTLYFISQIIDITSQKTFELQLANTIAYNQAILDASTQVAIIGTNKNGIITTFNEGAELLLGYDAEELINKKTPQLIHIEEEVESVAQKHFEETTEKIEGFDVFLQNAKKGKAETQEWTFKRKDGSTFPVLLSVTAIKQKDTITGFLGMAIDITAIKKAEQETLALLAIAESQNERLKNFAYIVSHNLRSHSAGISSLIELIESEFPDFSQTDFFDYLKKSSVNLSETIKHLTEVVQINLSTKEKLETVLLKPIIENNINSLMTLANKENVSIINEVNSKTTVKAIPAYLDSVIMNFITNAIKYSSKERDSYLKIQTDTTNKYVVLKFTDNGLGIDLKKHGNKLFGMYKTFHQHEDSRGIGLFITKNQIESMNGKIEVESEVNIGTTFKIYLEYEKN